MSGDGAHGHGGLLPFHVVEAAAGGDSEAINRVLRHYELYIVALSTRRFYDDSGNVRYFVDYDMRRRLETDLIVKILRFDAGRAAVAS